MINSLIVGEGATVPGGFNPNYGVPNWKNTQEEHGKEKRQIEVVTPGSSKYHFVRNVARHDCPRPQVHEDDQLHQVQYHQPRREEHSHPHHALVVDQVEDVLGYLEVSVLGEGLLQVPAPASVHEPHEHSAKEVHK